MRISDWSSDVCSSDLKQRQKSTVAKRRGFASPRPGGDQSPEPPSAEKYLSYLPSSPLCASASSGTAPLVVMLGHWAEKVVFSSSHFSSPFSVSGRTASAGHSGSRSEEHTSELQSLMR